MLTYVIKNVIVYLVIFRGKKYENGDNWYFPSTVEVNFQLTTIIWND